MKILIITNLFPNSKEPTRGVFNKQQFLELAKQCELKVIAPIPWHKLSGVPARETIDGIDVYHPGYFMIPKIARSLYGLLFCLSLLPKIRRLYKKFKFDAIFATWAYPDAFGSCLIAKALKKPIVIKAHGTDINSYTRYFLRRKMIVWALSNSDKVIAVSSALKDQMVRIGVPSEKIEVIQNGVNTDLFKLMDQAECRGKLKLPFDKKIILYVGNIVKAKGVDVLIDAFVRLTGDILLIVVGDGPYEKTLRARAGELGIEENVIFAGRVAHDEIRYYMNACDIFCLPSRCEGCPNVLLEAQACGLPVVASRVGGIPELIKTTNVGSMVKSDDVNELSTALLDALSKKWDKNLIRNSVAGYSWTDNASKLYDEVSRITE